jgi:flagellar hook-length control protein FliK
MSTMAIPYSGPIRSSGADKSATASPPDDANTATDGSGFGTIVNLMLASVMQNGQQITTDASKAVSGTEEAGIPLAQSQVPGSTQQAPDVSKLLLGLQDQKMQQTQDAAAAQFSDMLKMIKDGDRKPLQQPATQKDGNKETVEHADARSDAENAEAAKQDHSAKYIVNPFSGKKSDKDPFVPAVDLNNKGEGNEANNKAGSIVSNKSATDFTTLVQQEQPAAMQQVAHAGTAAEGAGRPITPLHSADPSDMFDHAVSIVKDGNRLAVQMDHGGLGKLDINLSLNKGIVNAQIQVADDATKNLLENNMQRIIHSLVQDGLSVGGFSVALKQHQTWDGTGENQKDTAEQKRTGYATQAISASGALDAGRGLVNIFI